jgi:hypothetical protein
MTLQLMKRQVYKRRDGAGSLFKMEESSRFITTQGMRLIFCTKG